MFAVGTFPKRRSGGIRTRVPGGSSLRALTTQRLLIAAGAFHVFIVTGGNLKIMEKKLRTPQGPQLLNLLCICSRSLMRLIKLSGDETLTFGPKDRTRIRISVSSSFRYRSVMR